MILTYFKISFILLFFNLPAGAQNIKKFSKKSIKENMTIAKDKTFVKKPMVPKITVDDKIRNACSNTRLDSDNGIMSKMIETKQESGTCYAHAAVQLYDAWRIAHLKDDKNKIEPSSVVSAAYIFKTHLDETVDPKIKKALEGGDSYWTLHALKFYPPCKMNKLKIEMSDKTFTDKNEIITSFFEKNVKSLGEQAKSLRVKDSSYVKDQYKSICSRTSIERLSARSQMKNYKDVMSIVGSNDTIKALDEAKFFECEKKDKNNSTDYMPRRFAKLKSKFDYTFFEKITQRLDVPKLTAQPIQISFCSNLAYKTGATDCGQHSAVIIGKRMDPVTKQCQFLVQDSGMPANFNTENARHEKSFITSQKMWVDAKSLIKHTWDMTYLEEPTKRP